MCEIRLIKTKDKNVIFDDTIRLSDINFGLIDRPAYVLNVDGKENADGIFTTGFHFEYLDSSETVETFKEDAMLIEFGRQSGRIYTYVGRKEPISNTMVYAFSTYANKYGEDQRFITNLRTSIKALNFLLSL